MTILVGVDFTAVSSTAQHKLGQLGMVSTAADTRTYKYVKYDTGAGSVAAVSGQVAYYYTLDGYKNSTVTSDLSDATGEIGAGVLQSAPTDGQYCWVQIKGPATLSIALTAGADGDPLTPTGATDGTLDVNVATAANTHVCARAGDISDKEILCCFPE
jgi:hypothetical protein